MGSHDSASAPPPPRAQGEDITAALNAIRRIVRALRLASSASEKALGVSGAQLFVLRELAAAGASAAPSIAELAARTSTDPSSVSVVVSRLVERGLAARRVAKHDARRAEVVITPAGRALLRKAPEPIQAKLIAGLTSLPEAQLKALAAGLDAVATAMGAGEGAAPMFFEDDAEQRRRKPGSTER